MTYSIDLRNKALKYIENGGTWNSASQTFGVAVRTLAHWLSRKKQICYTGTCDTLLFNLWLKDFLVPVLKPGQVVIMDNASFHKSQESQRLIEQAGCRVLFLPPYSPDLNPIEVFWANFKNWQKLSTSLFQLSVDCVCKINHYIPVPPQRRSSENRLKASNFEQNFSVNVNIELILIERFYSKFDAFNRFSWVPLRRNRYIYIFNNTLNAAS